VALAISAAGLMSMLAYVSSSAAWTFVFIAMFMLGVQTSSGPILGTIQTLVPEQMRAVSFALLYLVANLIGMGLGPVLAGVLSDAFVPWAGTESLRYALLLLSPGFFLSAWHLWRASRAVRGDLANAHARDARQSEIATAGAKRERFAGASRASETSAF
jgi:MFS family permease